MLISLTNKQVNIVYDEVVYAKERLERDNYHKGFEPLDELVELEASILKQCPKFAELRNNIKNAINNHDVEGAKKACDAFTEWENEDAKREEEKNAIKFVDSSVFSEDENKLNTKAYYSEIDFKLGDGKLMKLSEDEIKADIDRMLSLGYSREAITFLMERQKENGDVVLPHKMRYYQEFKSLEDMLTYYNYKTEKQFRDYSSLHYDKLDNKHVIVFKLPEETERLINQYI